MARTRKKATQKAILLRKRAVLRYLFTSELGLAVDVQLPAEVV